MDSTARSLASITLVALVAAPLFLTPVGPAGGSSSQAASAPSPPEQLRQTGAGNTPTATQTNTPTQTDTQTATPESTATPEASAPQSTVAPPTVRVVNDSVAPGDLVVVAATFTNDDMTAQSVEAAFRVFDETVDRQEVRVPAMESATVRFQWRVEEAGRYRFDVNGRTATADVIADEPTATEGDGSVSGADVTMVTAMLLAGGVVLLIRLL